MFVSFHKNLSSPVNRLPVIKVLIQPNYICILQSCKCNIFKLHICIFLRFQKCSGDIFVDGLLKPSLESGELARLTDQMIMIDPSLEKWNSYLTAACRYFVKNKLHHVLYEFQIFMKVRTGSCSHLHFLYNAPVICNHCSPIYGEGRGL